MITSSPGLKSWYPSIGHDRWEGQFEGCSPYYCWFTELGYWNLDIREWDDGEWAIVEYYNIPNIPSMTRWNYVLKGLKNISITPAFVERWVNQLDLRKRAVWDAMEAKDKLQDEEKARLDAHAQDTAERAKNIIMQTPSLVDRIAKNGLQEMNLEKILEHIPSQQLNGHKGPA